MPFSNALHPSITLDPTPMQQPNFSNAQVAPSSLAVLVLSNLLQDRTERCCTVLRGHDRSSKACRRNLSLTPPRRPLHLLKVLTLSQQVKLLSYHLSYCSIILYSLFVAHLSRMPIVIHTEAYAHSFYFTCFATPSILFPRQKSYSFPRLES